MASRAKHLHLISRNGAALSASKRKRSRITEGKATRWEVPGVIRVFTEEKRKTGHSHRNHLAKRPIFRLTISEQWPCSAFLLFHWHRNDSEQANNWAPFLRARGKLLAAARCFRERRSRSFLCSRQWKARRCSRLTLALERRRAPCDTR